MTYLTGYTFLVVDDEPDTLMYLATVLEDHGATVFQADNGDLALEIARRELPDFVTLDLDMPGKHGGDVFAEFRHDPDLYSIPICIVTGRPELRRLIYQRAVRLPEGYLDKPVDEKVLLMTVRKILALSHRARPSEA